MDVADPPSLSKQLREQAARDPKDTWPPTTAALLLAAADELDALTKRAEKAEELLRDIQWVYPPADGMRDSPGGWRGAARCPSCFADWTLAETHKRHCALSAALRIPSTDSKEEG